MNTLSSNHWHEQIKQLIQRYQSQQYFVLEGTVTSRSINPPSVKVMLEPYGVETGWIRVGTNAYGFLAIPPDQQAVKVIFDLGDINNGTVVCCVYNDIDTPPTLNNVDDVVYQHPSGAQVYFTSEGQVNVSSASGENVVFNGGTESVARVGDSVQVNVSGTNYTGTITSGASNLKA